MIDEVKKQLNESKDRYIIKAIEDGLDEDYADYISEGWDAAVEVFTRKHVFWGAGEKDCPSDIKAPNGELHTLRCKVCGSESPRNLCIEGENSREQKEQR